MPTTTSAIRDVPAEAHAGEIYVGRGLVCGGACVRERVAERRHVEDPTAVRDEPTVLQRRAGVEDERTARLRRLDAADRGAGVALLGIVAPREHDRHGCASGRVQRDAVEVTGRTGC